MTSTLRHAFPLIAAGQAQKDVTHNDALQRLDRRLGLAAESRSVMTPPANPQAGQAWIVPEGAPGWGAPAGSICSFDGHGWVTDQPVPGQMVLLRDEQAVMVHDGAWQARLPVAGLRIAGRDVLAVVPVAPAVPSGGAVVDSEARACLAQLLAAMASAGLLAQGQDP